MAVSSSWLTVFFYVLIIPPLTETNKFRQLFSAVEYNSGKYRALEIEVDRLRNRQIYTKY